MTSTADRGATTLENDDSLTTDLREAKAALHPPLPNVNRPTHISTMTTLDPQAPSPPSITDSDQAITSSSPRESIAGRTGGAHPPHVSHCSYDMA